MDTVHKVAVGTDAEFAMLKNMSEMIQASKRYEDASVKKFGDAGKLPAKEHMDLATKVEAADEKIDGDNATLTFKDGGISDHPMKLKKESGGWKVQLASMGASEGGADAGKFLKAMADAYDGTTKEIEAGNIKSAADAKKDSQQRMGKALMGGGAK